MAPKYTQTKDVPIEEQSHFDAAMSFLKIVGAQGYLIHKETDIPGYESFSILTGEQRGPAVQMLHAAISRVDPNGTILYDPSDGAMKVVFSPGYTTPPIRAVQRELERMRENILRHCSMHNGFYRIRQIESLALDTCHFAAQFGTPEEPACLYYRLPNEEAFTDKRGHVHEPNALVPQLVLQEFIEGHPDCGVRSHLELEPQMVALYPDTMQVFLNALGITNEQHRSGPTH